MPNIISVSRRTDIPAFYWKWFMQRVEEQLAYYVNPFGGQVYPVSLKPKDVTALIFWPRNYQPVLDDLPVLDQNYKFYFHYTITGLPKEFEPHVIAASKSIETFKKIAQRYSSKHIQWRFDPIVISTKTDINWQLRTFANIAKQLEGFTERCYFSFVDFYTKTKRNFNLMSEKTGIKCFDPTSEEKVQIAQEMLNIATNHGISLYACCEDLTVQGEIKKAHCVDGELIAELFPERIQATRHEPTRNQCGCFLSKDIGVYDTCIHGCVYCYANVNKEIAKQHFDKLIKAADAPVLSSDPKIIQKCLQSAEPVKSVENSPQEKQLNLF